MSKFGDLTGGRVSNTKFAQKNEKKKKISQRVRKGRPRELERDNQRGERVPRIRAKKL